MDYLHRVLQEQTASAWVTHGLQLLQRICSGMGHSPQAAAAFGACPCAPACSPPWPALWILPPLWSTTGCRETTNFTVVFSRGCREISVPVPGAHPSLLHWSVCLQGCLSHIFLVSLSQVPHSIFTLSKICYHRGATNIGGWPSFSQQWVHLRTSWNHLCLTQEQILISSYRSCPCSSHLLLNLCYVNQIYWPKHSISAWLGPSLGTAGKASCGRCRLIHYSKHLDCCRGFWNKRTLKLPGFLLFRS